jgi:hypothetical protein
MTTRSCTEHASPEPRDPRRCRPQELHGRQRAAAA